MWGEGWWWGTVCIDLKDTMSYFSFGTADSALLRLSLGHFGPKMTLKPSMDRLQLLLTRTGREMHAHPFVGNLCLP